MREQPHVDAVLVENVLALGQLPEGFILFEIRQADDALDVGALLLGGGVGYKREVLEDSGVNTLRLLGVRAAGGGGVGGGVGVEFIIAGAPPNVDREKAHEKEGAEQNHQDDGHGRAELAISIEGIGVGLALIRRRGRRRRRRIRGGGQCNPDDGSGRRVGKGGSLLQEPASCNMVLHIHDMNAKRT